MNKVLIIIIILFATFDIYGQFTLGPKIGYSSSKLSTDFDDVTIDVKHNFQIGAFARFGKKLYLQPEVYYGTSGGTIKAEGTDIEEEIKLKNLCIPVLAGFKLVNAKVFNLRILAGPSANFILDKKVESDELIQDPLQESNFKNTAWGMDVGAGMDIFFLSLDVRYEFGLNNIYNQQDGDDSQSIKSDVFIISLGFKLF
jgi:hypothetical protein